MAPPINDNVVDAIDLLVSSLKDAASGTIVDATIESDFEGHAPNNWDSQSVWYHFVPADDCRGWWKITKTGGDAGFVPEADLWHCTTYPPATSDDFDFVEYAGDGTGTPDPANELNLLAGEHYLISVEDYNYDPAEEGDFDLEIQLVPSYLNESWEDASIDPIVWELHRQSASPVDPNAGDWSLDGTDPVVGSQAVRLVPSTQRQQLFHHDVTEGGQSDRDYWIAYGFQVVGTWADVLATDSEGGFLPSPLNGNNFYPHTSSGLVASSFITNFWAWDSTTGYFEDLDFNPWFFTAGGYHEMRIMFHKRSSDGHLLVTQIFDGTTILGPNFDTGFFSGSITGVSWISTFNGGTSAEVLLDPLVWSPDTDPGPLVSSDSISVPFIAPATTLFTPTLKGYIEVDFISPETTVFDSYLMGDQDVAAPFISPTTTIFTPFLLGENPALVTQEPVEALILPTDAKARMTQEPIEVLVLSADAKARFTQVPIEVLRRKQVGTVFIDIID